MRFRKKRILIADKSRGLVLYLTTLLDKMGFEVIPCETGADALKLMAVMAPDMAMLDVSLGDVDVVARVEEVRKTANLPEIPVVIMSDSLDDEAAGQMEARGMQFVLPKPISLDELHKALQICLFMPLGQERKYMRSEYSSKVFIVYSGQRLHLTAKTLSEGGIYIRKTDPLPVGAEVDVDLPFSDEEAFSIRGTVIYTNSQPGDEIPPGMAIAFKKISKKNALKLTGLVKGLLSE